ncbi:MAG: hypothetical protein Q9P90_08750 [candidate division KSB1 bacterium]|nr:hypothetical protein [candidate division KSB1 bacterium]
MFKDLKSGNSIQLNKSTYCSGSICTFKETDELVILNKNTKYQRSIQACHSNSCSNAANVSAYTSIEAPTGVLFGSVTETSIQAKADGMFSNLTSGNSKIQIENVTTGTVLECANCNDYLTFTGLTACTTYNFRARACNGDCKNDGTGDYTGWTSEFSKSTSCAKADFTVDRIGSGWASTVCKGDQQIYGYRVNNIGTKTEGYFYNRLYIDNSYANNNQAQEFVSSNIINGQYWPASQGYTCSDYGTLCWTPSNTGNYNIVIKADSGNSSNVLDCNSGAGGAVTEVDETNNCSTSFAVNVIDAPGAPGTPTFSNTGKTSVDVSWTSAAYTSSMRCRVTILLKGQSHYCQRAIIWFI